MEIERAVLGECSVYMPEPGRHHHKVGDQIAAPEAAEESLKELLDRPWHEGAQLSEIALGIVVPAPVISESRPAMVITNSPGSKNGVVGPLGVERGIQVGEHSGA